MRTVALPNYGRVINILIRSGVSRLAGYSMLIVLRNYTWDVIINQCLSLLATYPQRRKVLAGANFGVFTLQKTKLAEINVQLKNISIFTNFKILKFSSSQIKLPGKFTPLGQLLYMGVVSSCNKQRCNLSAFLDSRFNSDSDKVFGFDSNSILQDAHCIKTQLTI